MPVILQLNPDVVTVLTVIIAVAKDADTGVPAPAYKVATTTGGDEN